MTEYGKIVYLTAKEFDLLYFLYSHKGQVFTKWRIQSRYVTNNLSYILWRNYGSKSKW
ncbi:helix-turn-helix domain-containing protein [Clostridioides difficile]|uniref:helix-turn-helix domain-containing protein n=1 Tax=Clostridioides difficile TaxID=1496 RepID=UPI003AA92D9E